MGAKFGMLRPEDAAEDTGYVMDLEATGCHFYLMDDWSSFESRPEFTADTFEKLTNQLRAATVELWKRTAQ